MGGDGGTARADDGARDAHDGARDAGDGARDAGDGAAFHARWEAALADLEVSLERAEAVLAGDHLPAATDPWRPPAGLGPLPAALEERARLLVERQIEVARRVAEGVVANRRQTRVLRGLNAGGPRRAVYVDTLG